MMRQIIVTGCVLAALSLSRSAFPAGNELPSEPIQRAAETLESWLQDGVLPPRGSAQAAVNLPGTGLAVTIRAAGRVVGSAHELPLERVGRGNENEGREERLRRVAGQALAHAMDDPALRDAQEKLGISIGRALYAEVEIAGRLRAVPARSWIRLAAQIEPGEGVALRRGDDLAVIFPSRIRTMNVFDRIEQVLPSLAVDLGLPPHDLAALRQSHGVQVYRFQTVHLVQPGPMRSFLMTDAGHVAVRDVDPQRFGDPVWFGDRLIDHVLTRFRSEEASAGIAGDYRPSADQFESLRASARDRALVALGCARLSQAADVPEWQRARLEAAADILLLMHAEGGQHGDDPRRDPVALAAFLMAFEARPALHGNDLLRAIAMESVTILRRADSTSELPVTGHSGALVIAGLASAGRTFPGVLPGEFVSDRFDTLYAGSSQADLVDLLPWAGEMLLERYERERADPDAGRLADLIAMLRSVQISDVPQVSVWSGGMNFGRGGAMRVDAQSLRAGVFLARVAGSPVVRELMPRAHEDAVAATQSLTRFVRQLAVRDDDLWAYRSPHRAIGGIRASLTNSDQPVAAQAMGLLYVAALCGRSASAVPEKTPDAGKDAEVQEPPGGPRTGGEQ